MKIIIISCNETEAVCQFKAVIDVYDEQFGYESSLFFLPNEFRFVWNPSDQLTAKKQKPHLQFFN